MGLNVQSISHIDNRKNLGVDGGFPPGPTGNQLLINPKVVDVIQNVLFALSNLLADGVLVGSSFDGVFTHPGI